MEYITKYDYEKYSFDKKDIEEWLNNLYEDSIIGLEKRNDEKEKKMNIVPFIIKEIDNYMFFLISRGYVNKNNSSAIFGLIEDNINNLIPEIETDILEYLCTTDPVIGSSDGENYFYTYDHSISSKSDNPKMLEKEAIFGRVCNALNSLIVGNVCIGFDNYYNQIKSELSGYNIDSAIFDKNINDAVSFIHYCLSVELYEDSMDYIGYGRDINDKYKSVLLNNGDNKKRSFQDEIKSVMAKFIKTDLDIKDKTRSASINSFTKKCLEGNYLDARCQNMSALEKDDFFMTLYYLGSLGPKLFHLKSEGLDETINIANSFVQAVDKVIMNKGLNKNGKKSS